MSFQIITEYAQKNADKHILVIDLCPQANLSELLLGGLIGNGGENLSHLSKDELRRTVGGYFDCRIQSTFNAVKFSPEDFLCLPSQYNDKIPSNVELLAGDRLVEIQATALSALANTQLPGVDARLAVTSWIKEFIAETNEKYDTIFIDTKKYLNKEEYNKYFAAEGDTKEKSSKSRGPKGFKGETKFLANLVFDFKKDNFLHDIIQKKYNIDINWNNKEEITKEKLLWCNENEIPLILVEYFNFDYIKENKDVILQAEKNYISNIKIDLKDIEEGEDLW